MLKTLILILFYKCLLFFFFSLLAGGYLLGSADLFSPRPLSAQDDSAQPAGNPISQDAQNKIAAARAALQEAQAALVAEGLYKPITKGLNPIAVLAGGVDAQKDLESGLGVDPGTFAALYAGLATDVVHEQLGRDAEGRLTYKKRLIQMYPISNIKKLYQAANVVSDDEF